MYAAAATPAVPPIPSARYEPRSPTFKATKPAGMQVKQKAIRAESAITTTPQSAARKLHTFWKTSIGLPSAALLDAMIDV